MIHSYKFVTEKQKNDAEALLIRLTHLSFPFLIPFKGKSRDNEHISVSPDISHNFDMDHVISNDIKNKEAFDEQKFIDNVIQGILALTFLHKHKIIHGKISKQTVFQTDDGIMRLGPADITQKMPEEKIPDEEKEKIEKAQDLYSFGAVMFELAELRKLPDELSKLNSGSKSTSPDSYKFKRLP
ncbi:MAG: hypothetical protein EZS28_034065, partial [Streblomastix strix]